MSNGRLTTLIDGREALPVRAIPYVTGWEFSPDSIAKELARRVGAPFSTLHNLTVYHLPDTTPIPVLPRDWDYIVAKLEALEAELKEQYPNDVIGYAAWRKNSANSLPSGVFVWLDEFEREYMAKREREHFIEPKREGDDELIFTPMLDTETRAMVMEGFGAGQAQIHAEVDAQIDGEQNARPGTPERAEQKAADWIEQVRTIGLEYITKHKASDLFPSQRDVCEHIEKIARVQKIYGPQGKPISQSYIQRTAIQGCWWKKNKP